MSRRFIGGIVAACLCEAAPLSIAQSGQVISYTIDPEPNAATHRRVDRRNDALDPELRIRDAPHA
jgi:hypothetical protein